MIIADFKVKYQKPNQYNLIGKIKLKVLTVLSLLLGLLIASQLIFAANLATDGAKLVQIDHEIRNLEAENTNLQAQIAKISSLTSLSQKATELGFKQPTKIITP